MFYEFIFVSELVITVACFMLAALLLYKEPRSRAKAYLALMVITTGSLSLMMVLQVVELVPILTVRLSWISMMGVPFYLLFLEEFFGRISRFERPVVLAILAISSALVLLNAATPLGTSGIVTLKPLVVEKGPLDPAIRASLGIFSLYVIAMTFAHMRKAAGLKRQSAKYFMAGTLIYAIGGIVIATVLAIAFGSYSLVGYGLPFFAFIWVLLTFYAVTRHHFLNIETAIHKTLGWLVFSILFIIPVHAFITVSRTWMESLSNEAIAGVTLVIFFITFLYFKTVQPRIDHVFQKRKYDLDILSIRFSGDLAHLGTVKELEKRTSSMLKDKLYASSARLVILDGKAGPEGLEDGQVMEGKNLLVPLMHKGKLIAYLELGKKGNLKPYTREELGFLSSISGSLSVAVANSLLYNKLGASSRDLERKVKERTRELTQKNEELEKFKKFSVGRELKMIELKKQLGRLKRK